MTDEIKYICVVCGDRVDALFKKYGPSVIKVTNCDRCGSISDKYIEYDPVIVMVDLILLSKEACRHVLYNTHFKAYWKLFLVLLALETYTEWSNQLYQDKHKHQECYFSDEGKIFCNSSDVDEFDSRCKSTGSKLICQNKSSYGGKFDREKFLQEDPFLTEKGVYVTCCCVFIGMLVFCLAVFIISILSKPSFLQTNRVTLVRLMKGLTLGGMGNLLMLPTIIWGNEHDTSIHAPLVLAYTTLALICIHSVMFECNKMSSFAILTISFFMKISSRSQTRKFITFLLDQQLIPC